MLLLQSVIRPASFQAERINYLFHYFNLWAAVMLALVTFLATYICIRFRRRRGDNTEGSSTTGNNKMELLMIGAPTLLLIWFFFASIHVEHDLFPNPTSPYTTPDVIITGHQFWWEIKYPGKKVVTANELHLPVGKHLLLKVTSADVIHDWWVPELGNKMDLVPGNDNYLWVDIKKPGDYIGACSEYCGAEHAWMRIRVLAQDSESYSRWLDSNAREAARPADSLATAGMILFQTRTCANCHSIRGTPSMGTEGPDLTHLSSRSTLLTGILSMNEEHLAEWIHNPQQIKPGSYMPDFMFGMDSVRAIAHYLEQLK